MGCGTKKRGLERLKMMWRRRSRLLQPTIHCGCRRAVFDAHARHSARARVAHHSERLGFLSAARAATNADDDVASALSGFLHSRLFDANLLGEICQMLDGEPVMTTHDLSVYREATLGSLGGRTPTPPLGALVRYYGHRVPGKAPVIESVQSEEVICHCDCAPAVVSVSRCVLLCVDISGFLCADIIRSRRSLTAPTTDDAPDGEKTTSGPVQTSGSRTTVESAVGLAPEWSVESSATADFEKAAESETSGDGRAAKPTASARASETNTATLAAWRVKRIGRLWLAARPWRLKRIRPLWLAARPWRVKRIGRLWLAARPWRVKRIGPLWLAARPWRVKRIGRLWLAARPWRLKRIGRLWLAARP